ncbi:unnamed protein product [Diamesa serratosioi]
MSDSDSDITSTTLSVCGADDDNNNEDDESHTVYLNIDSLSDNMQNNNKIYATVNDNDDDDKSDTEIEDLRPDINILEDGSDDEDDSLLIIY